MMTAMYTLFRLIKVCGAKGAAERDALLTQDNPTVSAYVVHHIRETHGACCCRSAAESVGELPEVGAAAGQRMGAPKAASEGRGGGEAVG